MSKHLSRRWLSGLLPVLLACLQVACTPKQFFGDVTYDSQGNPVQESERSDFGCQQDPRNALCRNSK